MLKFHGLVLIFLFALIGQTNGQGYLKTQGRIKESIDCGLYLIREDAISVGSLS